MKFAVVHFALSAVLVVLVLVEPLACSALSQSTAFKVTGVRALLLAQVISHFIYVTLYERGVESEQRHTHVDLCVRRSRFYAWPRLFLVACWTVAWVTDWRLAMATAVAHVAVTLCELVVSGALQSVESVVVGLFMLVNLGCVVALGAVTLTWVSPCAS